MCFFRNNVHFLIFSTVLFFLAGCRQERGESASDISMPKADRIIVAGERAGLITGRTSLEEILRLYGKENVRIDSIYVSEGESVPGAVLFPNTPKELEIAFGGASDTFYPDFIRVAADDTEWQTAEGIRVGTTLQELEKKNGNPFLFYGFEWDFGGLVFDWKEGRLNSNLIIALIPTDYAGMKTALLGDVELSSDNPELKPLGIQVGAIVARFD